MTIEETTAAIRLEVEKRESRLKCDKLELDRWKDLLVDHESYLRHAPATARLHLERFGASIEELREWAIKLKRTRDFAQSTAYVSHEQMVELVRDEMVKGTLMVSGLEKRTPYGPTEVRTIDDRPVLLRYWVCEGRHDIL